MNTCKSCKWFKKAALKNAGQCWVNPPLAQAFSDRNNVVGIMSYRTEVKEEDYCSFWNEKEFKIPITD